MLKIAIDANAEPRKQLSFEADGSEAEIMQDIRNLSYIMAKEICDQAGSKVDALRLYLEISEAFTSGIQAAAIDSGAGTIPTE